MSDIDDILNEIKEEESKDVVTTEASSPPEIIPTKNEDELIDLTLKKNEVLEGQADKIVDLFFDGLERGTDRTHSSKEQMLEALKIKLEINKSIIEMAKLKKKTAGAGVGIIINQIPTVQTGIDLENIKKAVEE
jgi:hypothetical protein